MSTQAQSALEIAIAKTTTRLLRSKRMRTVNGYVYDFERVPGEEKQALYCTTWGESFRLAIPQSRHELIALKMRAQLDRHATPFHQIVIRYTLAILRAESEIESETL